MRRPGFLADAGLGTKATWSPTPRACASKGLCFESGHKTLAACIPCLDGTDTLKACGAEFSACRKRNFEGSNLWHDCNTPYEECLTRAGRPKSPNEIIVDKCRELRDSTFKKISAESQENRNALLRSQPSFLESGQVEGRPSAKYEAWRERLEAQISILLNVHNKQKDYLARCISGKKLRASGGIPTRASLDIPTKYLIGAAILAAILLLRR